MKAQISENLNHPEKLEKLYRSDKTSFKNYFNELYPELEKVPVVHFWNERLNYREHDQSFWAKKDLVLIAVLSLFAGLIAKLPAILAIDEDFFYPRNIGFIVFPMLAAYFAWKTRMTLAKSVTVILVTLASAVFINLLPNVPESDTLILSCIHLLVFLWAILGFSFLGGDVKREEMRLNFLKYNGDLLVISALIGIAGGIMTGITFGLFSIIGIDIEVFYSNYVIIFALPAVPLIGTYLTQNNPGLVGKVSPVIARIFSPLVLVMLVIYLVAMVYSGKDPYTDRDFLLVFNVLLIGVMAIIFFSVAGASDTVRNRYEIMILVLLSVVTILVNGIALSAILFRISEWGITPNRIAVLGANVLILVNLLMVTAKLLKVTNGKKDLTEVGKVISWYLPIYVIWAALVTFLFPAIFGI